MAVKPKQPKPIYVYKRVVVQCLASTQLQGPNFISGLRVEFHIFSPCFHGLPFGSGFLTAPKHASRWHGFNKWPLGVNECQRVRVCLCASMVSCGDFLTCGVTGMGSRFTKSLTGTKHLLELNEGHIWISCICRSDVADLHHLHTEVYAFSPRKARETILFSISCHLF